MNRKNRITAMFIALVVAVSVTAFAAPAAAQSVDNIDPTLSDENGDGLDDRVSIDVTVSNVGSGVTNVTLGESNFDVDVSPTDTGQDDFVTLYDTDGDGTDEKVQFVNITSGSGTDATYTVVADLSGQSDSDTGSVDVELGGGTASSATYTVVGGSTPPPSTTPSEIRKTQDSTDNANGNPGGTIDLANNPTVYQGEDDVHWVNSAGSVPNTLTGDENSGAEGQQLDLVGTIPQNQETGVYGGGRVTVSTPRIVSMDVDNEQGQGVAGSEVQEGTNLYVSTTWNYDSAEDVELSVMDSTGTEVTGEALATGQSDTRSGGAVNDNLGNRWEINTGDLEAGEYTIEVAGVDSLDFGDATRTATISITSQEDPYLELEEDSATQGERVDYTVRASDAGLYHAVAIDEDDLRDSVDTSAGSNDPLGVFRNVGDTLDIRRVDGYVVAMVEVDDSTGVATGRIDTQDLDDTSVDVYLYESTVAANDYSTSSAAIDAAYHDLTDGTIDLATDDEDDKTLNVEEAQVTIDNPGATYVIGSEVNLNGTASQGLDEVAVYVRDEGDWQRVLTDTVESDGTWEEEDVALDARSDILSISGTYRIGIIDKQDTSRAAVTDDDGETDSTNFHNGYARTLDTSDFNQGTSSQRSIRVLEPSFQYTIHPVGGSVAEEDGEIRVTGEAVGADEVVVGFVGDKGDAAAYTVSVDDDYTFEEDLELTTTSGHPADEPIRQGTVVAFGVVNGRDDEFGDGTAMGRPTETPRQFAGLVPGFDNDVSRARGGPTRTSGQIIELLRAESVDETGSDDLGYPSSFRYTDGSTSINDVVPTSHSNVTGVVPIEVGETMMVRGTTNLQPDDNTISVEAVSGSSMNEMPVETTDMWKMESGVWSVTIDTTGLEPGTYEIESDDGDSTDTVMVEIVAEGERNDAMLSDKPTLADRVSQLQSNVEELQTENEELSTQVDELETQNEELNTQLEDAQSENEELSTQVDELEQENSDLQSQLEEAESGGQGQPGFGVAATLIALIGAGLIALRRKNE
ncbi:PGF-CTERM sorting domain-containing protein [Halorutilales archaeon Cl-col2-1]